VLLGLTFRSRRTLNAISPIQPNEADERTTRHLRLCAELADLAMQLARAAAARTLTKWAEPQQPPAAETQSVPAGATPSDAATASQSDPAPPPRGTSGHAATTAPCKPIDPAVLFTRFAAVVRDCIALEARLTAGAGPTTRAASILLRADPRRAPLREAFDRATENHPDRAELRRETTTRLDEELTADPDQTNDLGRLFFTLCDELGIEVDLAILPDEFLTWAVETADPDEEAPDPRATSPP
jgi:hypothetical protein